MNVFSRSLPRLAALLLVVLLLAACGKNNEDQIAPDLTYTGTDTSTTVRSHNLAGTMEPGATVTVSVDNSIAQVNNLNVDETKGEWSCTISNLAAGLNTVTVLAKDAAGNQNNLSIPFQYDALSIENYVTPTQLTYETISGLLGHELANSSQALTVKVNGIALADAAVTTSGDTWSADLTGLNAGDNTIEVSVPTTAATSGTVTQTLTINSNASAPQVTIDPVTSPTTLPDQAISGTRSSGQAVTLTAASVTTVADPTYSSPTGTTWTSKLTGLNPGKNVLTAAVTVSGITTTTRTLIIYDAPVVREIPEANATDVDPATTVQAFFPTNMDGSTIDTTSFTLAPVDNSGNLGTPVTATVTYDTTTRVATLTPTASLDPGVKYTATLTTAITDASATPLAQQVTWSFTTVAAAP